MFNSLLGRLMLISTVALILVLAGIGHVLDRSFSGVQLNAAQEKIRLQTYSILGQSQYDNNEPKLPAKLHDHKFNSKNTGRYAQLVDNKNQKKWTSISASEMMIPQNKWAKKGKWLFSKITYKGQRYMLSRYGVSWDLASGNQGRQQTYNLILMGNMDDVYQQIDDYRKTLLLMLSTMLAVLLTALFVIMRWGLYPLKTMANELEIIQQGGEIEIQDNYPKELKPLMDSLFRLIVSERKQRERYRNTMQDLSHSLKTPLTVMKGVVDDPEKDKPLMLDFASRHELQQQIAKMKSTIDYQLQRSVSGGFSSSIQKVMIAPVLESICSAMDKVYADKKIMIHLDVKDEMYFQGDENDLMEVLGNLIDNACKYGQQQVEVVVKQNSKVLSFMISDDGRGIDESSMQLILQRGQRLDTIEPGQGLGLALVKDILDSYQATIKVESSKSLGGACFCIVFPAQTGN